MTERVSRVPRMARQCEGSSRLTTSVQSVPSKRQNPAAFDTSWRRNCRKPQPSVKCNDFPTLASSLHTTMLRGLVCQGDSVGTAPLDRFRKSHWGRRTPRWL